ncbi:MAG: replication/maintenance protein RepL [Xenococcus sp. MO_188.B8]|nr:replication/maintenance protein RepL [Xenococcus sp. MO_188.B8]
MQHKKIRYRETTQVVDENGMIKQEQQINVIQFPNEPPFIKLYIEDLTAILKLPKGTKDLLYSLLMKMDYENIVTLTSRSKKEIAERVNIKIQTFDNYLRKLVDAGIFKRIGRGEYKVNPNLFARGDWGNISRQRDEWMLTITYESNGTRKIEGKAVNRAEHTTKNSCG